MHLAKTLQNRVKSKQLVQHFIFSLQAQRDYPRLLAYLNRRMLPAAKMSATALLRIKQTDRMYNCLPLYHGTGLMIGLTAAFTVGASTVVRRRLSISAFWDDIQKI